MGRVEKEAADLTDLKDKIKCQHSSDNTKNIDMSTMILYQISWEDMLKYTT